jgi:aminoglycoside phosphotransferase family enzyme/predicted kinase
VTEHEHDTLVRNLLALLGASRNDLIQTHISSVIVAGDVVYKLKKPVDFGFLDYSTLPRRKRFCEEEVRINGRYAPQLYLRVVPVTGTIEVPQLGGEGKAIEYAVKMRRFDQADQLDEIVKAEGLKDAWCDAVADTAAGMHAGAPPAEPASDFGTPGRVLMPMLENFDLMASLNTESDLAEAISEVKAWTLAEHARLKPLLQRRKENGFVRECHGDMHLHNIAIFEGRPMLFDAIEFNPYLSRIDVISDLAFLLMDLEYRGLLRQSRRILNRYFETTGDYDAVALLAFYKTYRAMVRAKVLALHAAQEIPAEERAAVIKEVRAYLGLARSYQQNDTPFLAMTHGFSGSGKSTFALMAVERFGALRLRSDIERMRLFRREGQEKDIYTPEATEATYARLAELAGTVIGGGYPAVADATFLKRAQRERFETLAKRLGVRLVILDITCDDTVLRRRIRQRLEHETDVSEADEAVLELQKSACEPLTEEEERFRLPLDCRDDSLPEQL